MKRNKKSMVAGILAIVLTVVSLAGSSFIQRNPIVMAQDVNFSSPQVSDITTWNCFYYGEYPQSEITQENQPQIYAKLQKANAWDEAGDWELDGKKYRRVTRTQANSISYENGWKNSVEVRYFAYEPIKWRILQNDSQGVYAVANVILDDQKYNQMAKNVTWNKSTLRSWLNGYDAGQNMKKQDFDKENFLESAFSDEEQNNLQTMDEDKVQILSDDDLTTSEETYGLFTETSRLCKPTEYAKAMGTKTEEGYGNWWTKDQGNTQVVASFVNGSGIDNKKGYTVAYGGNGVRPTILLSESSLKQELYAGTVSSDGSENIVPIGTPEAGSPAPTNTQAAPQETDNTGAGGNTDNGQTAEPDSTVSPEVSAPGGQETDFNTASPVGSLIPGGSMNPVQTMETEGSPLPDKNTSIPIPSGNETATPYADTAQPDNGNGGGNESTGNPQNTPSGVPTGVPNATQTPVVSPTLATNGTTAPVTTTDQKVTTSNEENTWEKGDIVQNASGTISYKFLKITDKGGNLEVVKVSPNVKNIVIPNMVEMGDKTFKVTVVGSNIVSTGQNQCKKILIGENVTTIRKNAFKNCKKVTVVKVKTKKLIQGSIGKNAWKDISPKAKVFVPKGKKALYQSFLRTAGLSKKAKIK